MSSDANRIYTLGRKLYTTLSSQLSREQLRRIYDLAVRPSEAEVRPTISQRPSAPSRLQQMLEVATVAREELHLDLSCMQAIVVAQAHLQGVASEVEIEHAAGAETLRLVQLLKRTSALFLRREAISSENFHNLLISMAEDIRVVLIIIADRVYRLRHARELYDDEEGLALAVEVSFLYAPIAHRLGLYTIKGEMEDLCLKWRDRKTFEYIVRKLGETKDEREAYIQSFIAPVRRALEDTLDVPFELKGRTKSISSIAGKLRRQLFEDIYDLFAIRIIVDVPVERERQVCWQIYSIITDMYRPNPERLKDWISIPKSNGYESLHITVMGPDNRWVEVQIRSQRMDAVAEQGVAAHWRYKGLRSQGGLDEFLATVRETLETVREQGATPERRSVLESSMMTLSSPEIYVFTPRGEVLKLPKGATVLDFAFSIHSRVGAQAISGKVNGRNVSIRHQLHNGDTVEVLTSPQQRPKQDWLTIVVSARAKARIRQLLRAEEEAGITLAKEAVQRRLKNRKLTYQEATFTRLTLRLGYKTLTDLYKDIANNRVEVGALVERYEAELSASTESERGVREQTMPPRSADEYTASTEQISGEPTPNVYGDVLIIDEGLTGVEYSLAKCCQPVFGDQVFGFVSTRGIKIHRIDCPNAPDMIERTGHRVLPAKWHGGDDAAQLIQIEVIGRDDIAVVTHIISLIKKEDGCQLRSYNIDSGDGLFRGSFTLYLRGKGSVSNLIKKIRGAVGVKQINRLNS